MVSLIQILSCVSNKSGWHLVRLRSLPLPTLPRVLIGLTFINGILYNWPIRAQLGHLLTPNWLVIKLKMFFFVELPLQLCQRTLFWLTFINCILCSEKNHEYPVFWSCWLSRLQIWRNKSPIQFRFRPTKNMNMKVLLECAF